jgi:putative chitinase
MSERLDLKYKTVMRSNGLTTAKRVAHFMAQIEHESGLKLVRENLFYTTPERVAQMFRSPFDLDKDRKIDPEEIEFAKQYLKNPVKLANYVYSNRNGNGSEASGDGYKYRAGGYIGTTGKAQYQALTNATGIDFVSNPDLILEEANAMISALYFWKKNKLNALADKDDAKGITRIINGGFNGLDHRLSLLEEWKKRIV